jgi:hypothetical protein
MQLLGMASPAPKKEQGDIEDEDTSKQDISAGALNLVSSTCLGSNCGPKYSEAKKARRSYTVYRPPFLLFVWV